MRKTYIKGYYYGDIDGYQRFFDDSTFEMLFKFLNNEIQCFFVKELGYIPDSESIIYYCTSAGGHYFFSFKEENNKGLILTSF